MSVPHETLRISREALVRQREELVRQREVLDRHIALLDAELRQASNGTPLAENTTPMGGPGIHQPTRPKGSSRPSGRDAVALVLREAGAGVLVSDDDVLDGMVARGIRPRTNGGRSAQMNAMRASANRLVKQQPERFERIRDGERSGYRYVGEPSSPLHDDGEAIDAGGVEPQIH
jgi:hypothetical protein